MIFLRHFKVVNWILATVAIIYLCSMILSPIFYPLLYLNNENWEYLQGVWDRWQTFNAAIIAFAASWIAFNISRYNNDQQREREFIAAKAFLPQALGELTAYFKSSAEILLNRWRSSGVKVSSNEIIDASIEYKSIFEKCIRHADPAVGMYLANLLACLQLHDARMKGDRKLSRENLIIYFYELGELQSLVDNIFDYARGESEFNDQALNWEDYRNSFAVLRIPVADIVDEDSKRTLKDFVERRIEWQKKVRLS